MINVRWNVPNNENILKIFSPSFHFLYGSLTGCFNSNNINYVLVQRVIISCNINIHHQILLANTLFTTFREQQLVEGPDQFD